MTCLVHIILHMWFGVLEQDVQMFVWNGPNPNHDGSSTERDEPNFFVLRNISLKRAQTAHILSVRLFV